VSLAAISRDASTSLGPTEGTAARTAAYGNLRFTTLAFGRRGGEAKNFLRPPKIAAPTKSSSPGCDLERHLFYQFSSPQCFYTAKTHVRH
jgi:hypothetical protein